MSRTMLWASLLAVIALFAAGCTTGETDTTELATGQAETGDPAETGEAAGPVLDVSDQQVQGSFSMVVMAHTAPYANTELEEQEPSPWDGSSAEGPYRYAAIPCNADAPINNISGDLPSFNSLIPGSRVPVSTRAHPLEFRVAEGDGEMQLEGTMDLTVCQLRPGVTPDPDPVPDPEKDRIRFDWTAQAEEATDESVVWRGTFDIVGGTGRYEELRGQGQLAGYFFCFAPEGCAEVGNFADVQFTMSGTYQAPAEALEQTPATEATEASGAAGDATEAPTEPSTEMATEDGTEPPTEGAAGATEQATE